MKFRKVLLLILSLALVNATCLPHFRSSAATDVTIVDLGEVRYDKKEHIIPTPIPADVHKNIATTWEEINDYIYKHKKETKTQLTFSFMESATIGQAISSFLNVPKTSSTSPGGVVAYNNDMKIKFGVDPKIINEKFEDYEYMWTDRQGQQRPTIRGKEESPEGAREMARAISAWYGTTFGIAFTGSSTQRIDFAIYDNRNTENPVVYNKRVHLPSWEIGALREGNNWKVIMEMQDVFFKILKNEINPASVDESMETEDDMAEPDARQSSLPVNQELASDGKTYVGYSKDNADENNLIWIKEENSWYALEYVEGITDEGSKMYVYYPSVDSSDYNEIYNQLDDTHKSQVEKGRIKIIRIGLKNASGNRVESFNGQKLKFYIQYDSNWDDDLASVYVADRDDEMLDVEATPTLTTPDGQSIKMAQLTLEHASPYVLYDKKENSSMLLWGLGGVGALAILYIIWQVRKAKSNQTNV